jgi:hypothetical protein
MQWALHFFVFRLQGDEVTRTGVIDYMVSLILSSPYITDYRYECASEKVRVATRPYFRWMEGCTPRGRTVMESNSCPLLLPVKPVIPNGCQNLSEHQLSSVRRLMPFIWLAVKYKLEIRMLYFGWIPACIENFPRLVISRHKRRFGARKGRERSCPINSYL